MGAPCKEVSNTQPNKYVYLCMNIETTRYMSCLWTGYFQDDSRKYVVMVTVDESVVTIDGELLHKSCYVAIVS